jgi:hypothetical protein
MFRLGSRPHSGQSAAKAQPQTVKVNKVIIERRIVISVVRLKSQSQKHQISNKLQPPILNTSTHPSGANCKIARLNSLVIAI